MGLLYPIAVVFSQVKNTEDELCEKALYNYAFLLQLAYNYI